MKKYQYLLDSTTLEAHIENLRPHGYKLMDWALNSTQVPGLWLLGVWYTRGKKRPSVQKLVFVCLHATSKADVCRHGR